MIKLSLRLQTIADLVSKEDNVIDVGCDHALLSIYITNKYQKKVYASDLREGAIKQAEKNIKKYNIKDIVLKQGNGLESVSNKKTNTVIIAGMGCQTILNILNNPKRKQLSKLLIQSNNDYYSLRKKICRLGYFIYEEKIIKDGHYYLIIDFRKGKKKYNYQDYYFGPILRKNKSRTYINYYKYLLNQKTSIKHNIPIKYFLKRYKLSKEINRIKKEIN